MKKNFWIRGNKEKADRINDAIHQLMTKDMPDVAPIPLHDTDYPNTLIVYDGVTKTICYLAFDSAIAQAIRGSSYFKELWVKPRFQAGQVVESKDNPEIKYLILEAGIPDEMGRFNYKVQLFGDKGIKQLISIEKMDSMAEPAFEKKGQPKAQPRFNVGQTVLFDGRVLTIHRIIDGYYLFNKEGSRGCRIDQQDKFKLIERKFKVGDNIRHRTTGVTATVASIEGMYYRSNGGAMIPVEEQDQWELNNPKFKVGDWIVRDYDGFTISIESLKDGNYYFNQGSSFPIKGIDEYYHLWTIEDAKDGDVLATDNGWTCIFQAFDGDVFSSYCFMDSQKWFCEFGSEAHTLDSRINGNIHPATKEQRDLLFAKMKEAEYQWDAGKKELRKIIEPKFKVGDLVVYKDLIGRVREVVWQDHFGWAYKVGNIIDIHECDLRAADHRDEVRILNRGSK